MTTERQIEGIYSAPELHWVGDGFRVMGYFSSRHDLVEKMSPFLLLDYHPLYTYPPTQNKQRGVGTHPHRGFETVTIAFAGSVAHHDSTGGGGVIGPGDVQWMTAAKGILHREYHEESYARRGGPMQMAQLWVNLPKAHKMDPPRYQPIAADQIAVVKLPDGAGQVRVIAGEYNGSKGPAQTFTPINLFDISLTSKGRIDLSFPAHQNTGLLVMSGVVYLNGTEKVSPNEFVLFQNRGEDIAITADSAAQLLLLNGEPINEPVVQYGPFVMNTQQEIGQAITDFNQGKFGYLED